MITPLRTLLGSVLAGVACLWSAAATAQVPDSVPSHPFAQSRPIPGRYIVVFKGSVGNPAAEAANLMRGTGGQLHYTYSAALKGFAASLPDAAVQALRHNPNVAYVEQDQTVSLSAEAQAQSSATWGLDRIDQASRPLDQLYHYNYTGSGVTAFIIDTGIRPDHVDFGGRVLEGFTVIADGRGTNDCDGHGTHVAGTVGGATWGVAKQVQLRPVRVLNCRGSGTYSGVIAGVDWVADSPIRPAVANMSLGGGKSLSMNAAVAGAVGKGVTMVVAAGNSSADACSYSPSSEPSALTVAATTSSDARSSYSNYGTCVDIFAPGSSITSAWNTSSSATNTISGTSMAAPHVAGVAALAIQANPAATPAAIASFIVGSATPNAVTSPGTGSPNLLLYSMGREKAAEPAKTEVAVKEISGTSTKKGRNWRAHATVTLRNLAGEMPVANATITGVFSAQEGTTTCVTDGSGSCRLTSAPIGLDSSATAFSVTDVSGTNVLYYGNQNSITQITIFKP